MMVTKREPNLAGASIVKARATGGLSAVALDLPGTMSYGTAHSGKRATYFLWQTSQALLYLPRFLPVGASGFLDVEAAVEDMIDK